MAVYGLSPAFSEWLALALSRGCNVWQLLKRAKSFLVNGLDWWLKGLLEERVLQGSEGAQSSSLSSQASQMGVSCHVGSVSHQYEGVT